MARVAAAPAILGRGGDCPICAARHTDGRVACAGWVADASARHTPPGRRGNRRVRGLAGSIVPLTGRAESGGAGRRGTWAHGGAGRPPLGTGDRGALPEG